MGKAMSGVVWSKMPWAPSNDASVEMPGPIIHSTVAPPSDALLNEYVNWCGALQATYETTVPAHLFPQWCFSSMADALSGLPFALTAVLNQGCKLTIKAPIPRGEKLDVTAQLTQVVRTDKKIKITTTIQTGPASCPDAVTAEVYAVIPLKGSKQTPPTSVSPPPRKPSSRPKFPHSATVIAVHNLTDSSGVHYAALSGDFNPIHVSSVMARAAGFNNVILHGFGQLALVIEDLIRSECGGKPDLLSEVDVRFVGSVVLPMEIQVGVDVVHSRLAVSRAGKAGEEVDAALLGSYRLRRSRL